MRSREKTKRPGWDMGTSLVGGGKRRTSMPAREQGRVHSGAVSRTVSRLIFPQRFDVSGNRPSSSRPVVAPDYHLAGQLRAVRLFSQFSSRRCPPSRARQAGIGFSLPWAGPGRQFTTRSVNDGSVRLDVIRKLTKHSCQGVLQQLQLTASVTAVSLCPEDSESAFTDVQILMPREQND